MTRSSHSKLSRRTFLRGAGVALALPWLEAMQPRSQAADAAAAPQRFVFIYTPNGYRQETFVPQQTGVDWELPPALEPLAAVREHVSLVTGLDRTFVGGTGVHAQCGACWLTSSPPHETLDGGFPTNITLDQMLARKIRGDTLLPSLELSCNDFTDNKETKYFESISWLAPGCAASVEKQPRAVFERLFGKAQGPSRSVLDALLADAADLRRRLGQSDRAKLDEYIAGVRSTERQIERAEAIAAVRRAPDIVVPAGIPADRRDYLRLMADLCVHAFEQDVTRVVTLVVDPERWDSPRMYDGVFEKPQNHHVLTHTKGDEAKAALTKIDRFHVDFFAYVVARLQQARAGTGTLLDATCVAMGSGISDGDSHNYQDLDVLLAGRGAGLRPGRHHHYAGRRPLADLWLTLANQSGLDLPRFADSTGTLTELCT